MTEEVTREKKSVQIKNHCRFIQENQLQRKL